MCPNDKTMVPFLYFPQKENTNNSITNLCNMRKSSLRVTTSCYLVEYAKKILTYLASNAENTTLLMECHLLEEVMLVTPHFL